jgi:hypothetical protein
LPCRRAVKEWKRNHAREAAQERSRGAQINTAAGVSEADMLAASAVGRRHELLLASAARAAQQLEQQAQVRVMPNCCPCRCRPACS